MFTAPSGFPGPNISVYLTLHIYFWAMPVVASHKLVRLRGPSYQSLSSFHLLPTLVLLLYYFFSCLFFSQFFSKMFLLSSFIRARIPQSYIILYYDLWYSNDCALWHSSPNAQFSTGRIQDALASVQHWASFWGFKSSLAKCIGVVFTRRNVPDLHLTL